MVRRGVLPPPNGSRSIYAAAVAAARTSVGSSSNQTKRGPKGSDLIREILWAQRERSRNVRLVRTKRSKTLARRWGPVLLMLLLLLLLEKHQKVARWNVGGT